MAAALSIHLKQRILFTLGALVVFRLGTHVQLPGIDLAVLSDLIYSRMSGVILEFPSPAIFALQGGVLDLLTGGAFGRLSILACGLLSFVAAVSISQILRAVVHSLASMRRAVFDRCVRLGTVAICLVQSYVLAARLEMLGVVTQPGIEFQLTAVATLTAGTLFLLWLADQITRRGLGHGALLIVACGVLTELPHAVAGWLELGRNGALAPGFMMIHVLIALIVVALTVVLTRARRRIVVQYPHAGRGATHLPLGFLIADGAIPPIFAAVLAVLAWYFTEVSFASTVGEPILSGAAWYSVYLALIFAWTVVLGPLALNPNLTARNLEKDGGFVPGIRPGRPTADYLRFVTNRLLPLAGLGLAAICALGDLFIFHYWIPPALGGTSLLILTVVAFAVMATIHFNRSPPGGPPNRHVGAMALDPDMWERQTDARDDDAISARFAPRRIEGV